MNGVLNWLFTVRLYHAGDNLGKWEKFWYESGAGLVAQPIDLQSSMQQLRHPHTPVWRYIIKNITKGIFLLISSVFVSIWYKSRTFYLYNLRERTVRVTLAWYLWRLGDVGIGFTSLVGHPPPIINTHAHHLTTTCTWNIQPQGRDFLYLLIHLFAHFITHAIHNGFFNKYK